MDIDTMDLTMAQHAVMDRLGLDSVEYSTGDGSKMYLRGMLDMSEILYQNGFIPFTVHQAMREATERHLL